MRREDPLDQTLENARIYTQTLRSGRFFLNLDAAISIVPLERTGLTRVAFIGAEKATAEVKETPDYLTKTADSAHRID